MATSRASLGSRTLGLDNLSAPIALSVYVSVQPHHQRAAPWPWPLPIPFPLLGLGARARGCLAETIGEPNPILRPSYGLGSLIVPLKRWLSMI